MLKTQIFNILLHGKIVVGEIAAFTAWRNCCWEVAGFRAWVNCDWGSCCWGNKLTPHKIVGDINW